MIGLAFKLSAEGSPVSGSLRVLDVDITLERVDGAVEALRELVGRLPDHPALLSLIDIYVANGRLVAVTPPVTGDALDRALELYGRAAVDDALPRLRQIAGALDRAAQAGFCHGALRPADIIVSADETRVAGLGIAAALAEAGGSVRLDPRYAAPEVLATGTGSPAGDQFSLAVVAHEWMFGGVVTPADGFVAVPALPSLNVGAMQRAFDTATAADPAARFTNCLAFSVALERGAGLAPLALAPPEESADEELEDEIGELPLRRGLGDAGEAGDAEAAEAAEATVAAGFAGSLFNEAPPSSPRQFGLLALAGALVVGVVLGAAGMRLLTPSDALRLDRTSQDFTDTSLAQAPSGPPGPTEVVDTPVTPPRDDLFNATQPLARVTPDVAPAAQTDAGLLIHSTPAGATVTIDGVPSGTTPVAVRGLELGARRVGVSRPGYQAAERLVTLTAERPSRTLDIDLVAVARPSAPAVPAARPAAAAPVAANGSLVVDSRPAGASVTVDGRPAGNTPVTLTGLAPGRRTVRIERPGYRTVTTSVDVKAGERARVAARLEGGPNEE